ncbi:hypothetical protein GCM10027515_31980 [Schumannella luteola]|uniref:Micrococcal nuclease n=1 Tax=Schumannella luteola TaxID=472059 RepID=A0A852YCU9_9MICO|nr:thermonuclease family protein [Schumannella luteola]NYG99001.1 micrococcal nuclease [Schumannella luteola]TPX06363.1 hypothetical protein FJ656_01650 [Schumannella luteola]
MRRRRSRLPLLLGVAIAVVVIGMLTGVIKLDDLGRFGIPDHGDVDAPASAVPATAAPSTAGPVIGASAVIPATAAAATIVRVVDGDTVVVRRDGRGGQETVRLAGIDTPETVKPNSPVECWGPEASAHTTELLPAGTAVRLEPDPTQGDADRYGRLLRYLWVPASTNDGTGSLVNLTLVREGFAEAYRDRHARWQEFQDAQSAARSENAGLWGAC